jgi:hypothetical protein
MSNLKQNIMRNKEALVNELNLLIDKHGIQHFILENHEKKKAVEICEELKISLAKFAGNRLALGGTIDEAGFIQLDKKKAKNVLKGHIEKIAILHKKIKNSASVQQAKKQNGGNPYDNHGGLFKQQARDIMVNAISRFGSPLGTILTLPSYTCALELQILNRIGRGINFIGCERDFDVFQKMVNKIAEERRLRNTIIPRFGEIGETIYNSKENQFAHMILDYCGTINTFHKEIEYAIQNDLIEVEGTICITVSKNGLGNNNGIIGELLRQFPEGTFSGEKETEMGIKLFLNKVMKSNYRVETFFNYCDTSAMALIVIRRVA